MFLPLFMVNNKINLFYSQTCFDEEEDSCLTCDSKSFRIESGSSCICEDGYFDIIN